MQVIDLFGNTLNITDLDAAMEQAAEFAGYTFEGNNPDHLSFHEARKRYWNDLYERLKCLQNENVKLKNNENHI